MKTLLALTLPLVLLFSGCASIPPEALTHVGALKEYHKKTSAATIGVIDTTVATIRYNTEEWKIADGKHSQEHIESCDHAALVLDAIIKEIDSNQALIEQLILPDESGRRKIIETIAQRKAKLKESLSQQSANFRTRSATTKQRTSTNAQEFTNYIKQVDINSRELHTLVDQSSQTLSENITAQEELLKSYLAAQTKIKQVFGAALAQKTQTITNEAAVFGQRIAPIVNSISSSISP